MADTRSEIREFLSTRRARITPEAAGLPAYGGNRRVPGLRREEVAMLTGVSVDYYVRLERGNLAGASESVLDSLARTLKLKLVGELSTQSELFRERWASRDVMHHRSGVKRLHHPVVGDLDTREAACRARCAAAVITAGATRRPEGLKSTWHSPWSSANLFVVESKQLNSHESEGD